MLYSCSKLRAFTSQVMQKAGLGEEDSNLFAESLVEADMRGVPSHGITRLTAYSRRVAENLVNTNSELTILNDGITLLALDGNNSMGVTTAAEAMRLCIERAREYGCCFASIRGGCHFGTASFFTEMAVKQKMIGICASNGPTAVAPIGGKVPFLGTNPLSVAIPAKHYRPLVLDMATSVVARGKITLAQKKETEVPIGWGVDADGSPTNDPGKILNGGAVLPFGGAKGFAISLIIEILCTCLAGGKSSRDVGQFYDFSGKKQDLGFFLGAIDVDRIMPIETFTSMVDDLFAELKSQPKGKGVDEIMIPGEIELNNYKESDKNGIDIPDAVIAELSALSDKYQVLFDCKI